MRWCFRSFPQILGCRLAYRFRLCRYTDHSAAGGRRDVKGVEVDRDATLRNYLGRREEDGRRHYSLHTYASRRLVSHSDIDIVSSISSPSRRPAAPHSHCYCTFCGAFFRSHQDQGTRLSQWPFFSLPFFQELEIWGGFCGEENPTRPDTRDASTLEVERCKSRILGSLLAEVKSRLSCSFVNLAILIAHGQGVRHRPLRRDSLCEPLESCTTDA